MKHKVFRPILYGLFTFLFIFCVVMAMPRLWSAMNPNKPPVGYHFMLLDYVAIGTHLEKLVEMSPAIPDNLDFKKDIEYKNVGGKSLKLDILRPKNITADAPLIVFIHGGGWTSGRKEDYLCYMVPFAEKGYVTASLSYRLLEEAPYPACAEDIDDAVKWVFTNSEKYGYSPEHIALVGGSAGAHLAMLAAYGWGKSNDSVSSAQNYPHIRAVVDIYGPADLTTPYARAHPLVTSFLATSYEKDPGFFSEASPMKYISRNSPPTLILHGTSDQLVPVSQSDTLKARLDRLGVPAVYFRFPLWPHAMDVDKRVNDFAFAKMSEFFVKYLK